VTLTTPASDTRIWQPSIGQPYYIVFMTLPFLEECVAVLARTPATLTALLHDLPEAWTTATDGPGTWSPYDVVGHLIHGERTDWVPRLAIILEHGPRRPFDSFDREGQFSNSYGKSLSTLLEEFRAFRSGNLDRLRALNLRPEQLELKGTHPELGVVTVRQLLATWTAHDLAHVVQVSRVMARRYKQEVGPWAAYLSVMK
jgi:DinB superfamily